MLYFRSRRGSPAKVNRINSRAADGEDTRRLRKKTLAILCVCVAAIVLAGAVSVAIYSMVRQGWEQKIQIASFTFKLNGKACDFNDDNQASVVLTPRELALARGEEASLDLEISVDGYANNRFCVPYQIDIALEGDGNELARAVEVYRLTDGEYVFVGMLNELVNPTRTIGNIDNSGDTETYMKTTVGIKGAVSYKYRLVYSEGAGEFYEDKSFTLRVTAKHTGGAAYTNDEFYVYNETDFESAAAEVNSAGYTPFTIVLLNDITLDSDISLEKKVGINLNGHTLNFNGHNIVMSYADSYTAGNAAYSLALTADSAGQLTGTGAFSVSAANDVLKVSDCLKDDAHISIGAFDTAALCDRLDGAFAEFRRTPVPSADSTVNFIGGYAIYFQSARTPHASLAVTDTDVISAVTENGECTVADTFDRTVTASGYVRFSLGGGNTFGGSLTLLGSSAYSVAERIAGKLPSLITSSLYLPVYDTATGARITWVSQNKDILDDNGVFLPEGYTALDNYQDQNTDIGLIVETAAGEKHTAVVTRRAEILTPEERTRILYGYPALMLGGVGDTLDITDGITNKQSGYLSKFGFVSVAVSVDTAAPSGEAVNINYTGNAEAPLYINLATGSSTVLECLGKPENDSALVIPATLIFKYYIAQGDAAATDYPVSREILLLGTEGVKTRDDATVTLQEAFSDNAYTNSADRISYSFLADGSYGSENYLVDYVFPDEDENTAGLQNRWADNDIIEIINGIYTEDAAGAFVRDNGVFRLRTDADTDAVRYSRKSLIIIKPESVGTVTDTAYLEAKLVTDPECVPSGSETYSNTAYLAQYLNGTVAYRDIWAANEPVYGDVSYTLSLLVEGLYHLRAAEIADAGLYTKLLTCFDYNADGYISVGEAQREPKPGCATETDTDRTAAVHNVPVLNFEGLGIGSLKGIEYFINVRGLDLDSTDSLHCNSVTDISYLSNLDSLEYLSMKNNRVADISALRYLDSLRYLDLGNTASGVANRNNITDLSPLRYLPVMYHLDLNANDNLTDISALQDYSALKYLDVRNEKLIDSYSRYYITLIYSNCSSPLIYFHEGVFSVNNASNAALPNAANALNSLVVIDETFNTLNLRSQVSYNGNTYYLSWTSSNKTILDFKDSNGSSIDANTHMTAASWELNSPTIDTDIEITLYISETENGEYLNIARRFMLNVMQLRGHANMTYIQAADGTVHIASGLVPDTTLRGLLFDSFNTVTAGTVTVGGVVLDEKQIVTQNEITAAYADGNLNDLNFSSKGITELSGIEAFGAGIKTLDLRGNTIADADISPLSGLTNMTTLYLNGQEYDFTQLSKFTENAAAGEGYTYSDADKGIYGSGLTSLENLSVFGCYGLDDSDVLASLYQVYLMNKNVDIYLAAAYTGTTAADNIWNPYALPLAGYINSMPSVFNFVTLTTGANDWHTTGLYRDERGALRVNAHFENGSYYYTFRFYDVRSISFTVTGISAKRAADSSVLKSDNNFYCVNSEAAKVTASSGAAITGFAYAKLVGYTDTVYTVLTVSGAESADFNVNTGRNEAVSGDCYVEHIVDFNHHIKLNIGTGTYSLNEIFPGRDLLNAVIGAYSVSGTTHTLAGLTTDTVGADGSIVFTLGNGKLDVGSSLNTTGLFLAGGKSSVQGLQYTTVTDLQINREAIFGNGEWLVNVEKLYIGYSAVDLSTLSVPLTRLTDLTVGSYRTPGTQACWDFNMYDKGEIDIENGEIYRYVVGLDKSGPNHADIINGNAIPTAADYLGACLQKEAFFNEDTAGTDAETLYGKLREIARSTDADGKYYFYLNYMPNIVNFKVANTPVADWTGLLAFMFREDTAPASGTDNYFNNGYYDKNSLETITVYRNNNSSTSNSNGGIAEPIIRKLYYASPAYSVVSANPVTLSGTPEFRIGSLTSNTSTDIYHPESFTGSGITSGTGWHDQQYTHWSSTDYESYFNTAATPYTQKPRDAAAEAAEFIPKIIDFGVKLDTADDPVYHYESVTQTVPSGGKLYLPADTSKTMFGTDASFLRNYPVTWTKLNNSDGTPAITSTATDGCYEYAPSPTQDTYMVFIGTCAAQGVTKVLYYPVLFRGSADYVPTAFGSYTASCAYSASSVSYAEIADLQLRLFLYINVNSQSPRINPTATALDFAAENSAYAEYTRGIVTLDGIGIYQSLAGITNLGGATPAQPFINDASDLRYLTGLTSVTLSGCSITDVSWARTLTGLLTLDLSGNLVRDTYDGTGTYFPASLTTLNLKNNTSVRHDDITPMSALTALATLNLNGTVASHEEEMLTAAAGIFGSSTTRTVTLCLTDDTGFTATKAIMTAAASHIAGELNDGVTNLNYADLVQSSLKTNNYGKLIIDTSGGFNTNFGSVTVSILNTDIYSNGSFMSLKSDGNLKIINYLHGFTVSVALNEHIVIYKTGYAGIQDPPSGTIQFSGGVTLGLSDIDSEIYAYMLRNWDRTGGVMGVNSEGTVTGTGIEMTGQSTVGIRSLKGLDKIPGLTTVRLAGGTQYIMALDTLGFTQDNTGIQTLRLGNDAPVTVNNETVYPVVGGVDISSSGMTSVSRLTALETLSLSGVSGMDYYDANAVAAAISGIAALTTLDINNLNYYRAGSTGVAADKYMLCSAGGGMFGAKALTAYDSILSTKAWRGGAESPISYPSRSHLSSVYTASLWWGKDSLTTKSVYTDSLDKNLGGITGWVSLLEHISDVSGSRVTLPAYIHLSDVNGADPDYPDRKEPVVFTLPDSFYLFGTEYAINWSCTTDSTGTVNLSGVFTDSGSYHTLTLSEDTVKQFNDGDIITLTGICGGTTVTHKITVVIDEPPTYYTKAEKDENITAFYIQMENGEIVAANQFFDSYRLLYWLYNISQNKGYIKAGTASVYPATLSSAYTGKFLSLPAETRYFSYEQVMSITDIAVQNGTSDASGIGVASLKGLELFKNLQRLTIRQGYVTSLEPIRNMRLTYFWYNNSNTGSHNTNTIIQDWTPLYNSRDTLEQFTYMYMSGDGTYTIYAEDFSFLMSFTNLTDVYIGRDGNPSSINETPAFKYMLAWNVINNKTSTINYNDIALFSSGSATAGAGVTSDMLAAARILSSFSYLDGADFNYINNFELTPKAGKSLDDAAPLILPGYINYGGALYPIEWVSESSFADVSYVTSGGDAVTVTDENAYFNASAMRNRWTVKVTSREAIYLSNIRLIARIKVGNDIYERMFTINCADDTVYPSLTLAEGFASYTLGSGTFTADAGCADYYSISGDGKTICLTLAAVGHDVYVNIDDNINDDIDGVRTKVVFSEETGYFNTAASHRIALNADIAAGTGSLSLAEVQTKLAAYDAIPVGMWQYMSDAYPGEFAAMQNIIKAIDLREELLSSPAISITYSGADSLYTTTNPATWQPAEATHNLSAPTRAGYYFIGWYTDAACEAESIITTLSIESLSSYIGGTTLTLYPRFAPSNVGSIIYNIPTEVNGSAFTATNPNPSSLGSASDSITLTALTNMDPNDCVFGGWYLDAAYTLPVAVVDAYSFNTDGAAITVYARVIRNAVMTLQYGGTGFTSSNPIIYDGTGSITLLDATGTGTNAGMTFVGWNTASDGSGDWVAEITPSLYTSGTTYTLYPRFTSGTVHTYLALTTYFKVGKLAAKTSWGRYTFYYNIDSGSVNKIQLNGDTSLRLIKFDSAAWTATGNAAPFGASWAYDDGTDIGSAIWNIPLAAQTPLGSYSVTYNHTTSSSPLVTLSGGTPVYTLRGSAGMGTLGNTPLEDYMFVYLYTIGTGASAKDIYALWVEKSDTTIGMPYHQTNSFRLRVIQSTSADSGSVTGILSQQTSGQYFETSNPAGVTDAINVGGFSSYNNATGGGEFLIFCPQGGINSTFSRTTGGNSWMNYGNKDTVANLYNVVGKPQ